MHYLKAAPLPVAIVVPAGASLGLPAHCGSNHACIEHVARASCLARHDGWHCRIMHRWEGRRLARTAREHVLAPPTSCGSPACNKALAYTMAFAAFHDTAQANCLVAIIDQHENNSWLPEVPGQTIDGPWGLPQADPGWKMNDAGTDWQTNPATQLRWMIGYVGGEPATPWRHWSSPCAALANENAAS